MMCKRVFGLLLILPLVFFQQAFSGGTQDGGGGTEEAKIFMITARAKVMLLAGNSKTSKFGLQLLETIEARPKINLVPTLAKTCDGNALSSHYGYSCTGVINLLRSTWGSKKDGGRGFLENVAEAEEHWQDILHELARASNSTSQKFVTNDEGYTETTKPEVMEAINRNSRMSIDIVAPSKADIKNSLEQYIQTISTSFGIGGDSIETNWFRVPKSEWYQTDGYVESNTRHSAILAMKQQIKDEYKNRIETVIHYETMQQCRPDLTAILFDFSKQAGTPSADTFSSFYKSRAGASTVYCANDAKYVKAIVRISARLKSLDQEFQQFLVGRHIQKTTQDLIGSLQEFVKGLSAVEMNPVISRNRFASFGINSSAEVNSWMDFHIARVRQALAYVRFVDRLNLGFEIKSLMYNLRQQAVGALRKLNQFEDPAIYIVQIDYADNQKPSVSPVFELSQLRALVQAADVGLPPKGTTLIKNRSRVEAAGYTTALTTQLRCDVVFEKMLAESVPQRVIDGANEFRASATFLFRHCADRFEMKQHKTFEESPWQHGYSQDNARETARQGAVKQLEQLKEIPNCAVYEVLSNSDSKINSENFYFGTGMAVMRWVCLRPSTSLKN